MWFEGLGEGSGSRSHQFVRAVVNRHSFRVDIHVE